MANIWIILWFQLLTCEHLLLFTATTLLFYFIFGPRPVGQDKNLWNLGDIFPNFFHFLYDSWVKKNILIENEEC